MVRKALRIEREELDDDKTKILKDAANAAEEELERTLGSETWLLPVQCRTRLEKMAIDLKSSKHKHNNWQEFLDDGCFIIKTATGDVRTMVVEDLGLKRKWYDLL
jgi:hypothetical protein